MKYLFSRFAVIAAAMTSAGVAQASGGTDVHGHIAADTTWRVVASPIQLSATVVVTNGATLTIEPGATLWLGSNVDLIIADGARLRAEGTAEKPIRFLSPPKSDTRWGGIIVNGSEDSPETRITHAHIEGNDFSAIYSSSGTLWVEHVDFGSTDRQYMSLDDSSFVIANCHFPTATERFELVHGTKGLRKGGRGVIRDSFFGSTLGYSDVIDFTGGNRTRHQSILHVLNCVFTGSSDDELDLDGTDAWIEGNIFLHSHKNGAPDTSSAISGGRNRRNTSEVTIIGNLFFDCDQAATAKEGNFFTLLHNTIVHMTKTGGLDTSDGAVCMQDLDPSPTTFGTGAYLEGNIIADVERLVRNYDKSETIVTFQNNLLPMAWDGPGGANKIGDPKLTHVPDLKETQFTNWASAQVVREWFRLRPDSPARGAGPAGRDLGGVVPSGAWISGEPQGTTDQTSATLTVGWNRQGHGMPEIGWPLGSGYSHYKWRLDGGAWSDETPIDKPIALTGLADGAHTVEVIGKRDSGLYQNDPVFGANAVISKSRTWMVKR